MKNILLFPVLFLLAGVSVAVAQAPVQQKPVAPVTTPVVPKKTSSWMSYKGYQNGDINLTTRHISGVEVARWSEETVAEVLTFGVLDSDKRLEEFKQYFVKTGWEGYQKHLTDSQILQMVREKQYAMNAIIDGNALIIKDGVMGGSYRWLVKAPVILSFFQTAMDGSGKQTLMATGKFELTLQIGRVAKGGGELGVAIENWVAQRK